MIRHHGKLNAVLIENARRCHAEISQLYLASVGEKRSDNDSGIKLFQILLDAVDNQVTLSKMVQCYSDIEFLCDSNSCKNIIGTVRMYLQRELPANNGKHGGKFEIVIRLLLSIILCSSQFSVILQGIEQGLSERGSNGHPCIEGLAVRIYALWVLSESRFHGNRFTDYHVLHPAAGGFHCDELASYHIGTAGTGHYRCHAAPAGFFKASVKRIDCINRTKLRSYRV